MQHQLTNPTVIRTLMDRHGVHFSKALGQNFLINPGVCPKMAEMGGAVAETGVLEIGPGIGVLTVELAKRAAKVVSVELDNRLLPVLAETLADYPNATVVHGDVMKLDLLDLIGREFEGMGVVVCANLPYYITSPVLMRLLEERLPVRSITVMVQREAALRICAPLPSRQAGAITAAIAYYTQPRLLFGVSKGSFLPAPAVDSSVIRLDVRPTPPVEVADESRLFQVIRGAFSQRRKTILNCLSAALAVDKQTMRELLGKAQVKEGARAEQLTLEDFARITNVLAER